MPRKKNPLAGIKVKDLKFEDAPDARMAAGSVPDWVNTAIGFLRDKLASLGIDLNTVVMDLGEEALHKLIALVEKAPPSFQKWLILAALNWLHKYMHSDPERMLATLKGGA